MARTVKSLAVEVRERELTLTGRAAWLTWQFAQGESFTVEEIMRIMGLSESGAKRMLNKMSQATPIFCCEGRWQVCS